MPRKTTTKYDGFISYRHTSRQIDIAASFQRALHQFAKSPWYRLRAVRLYRDETDLGASPDAWLTIEEAMDASRFLILMASPEASASHWINGEIRYWLQKKGQDSLVIVLTDGKLSWDSDTGQFDPVRTNALPPAALQYIDREPIWVDLTDVSIDEMKIEKTTFLNAVASVSSTLRGIPKEQLLGEDRRIQRRRFRFFAITATVVIGLVIATAYSIIEQRDLALKTAAAETKALEEQTARLKAEADALEARALAAEAAAKESREREAKLQAERLAIERARVAKRELVRALATQSLSLVEQNRADDALQLAIAAWPRENDDDLPATKLAVKALHTALLAHAPTQRLPLERIVTAGGLDASAPMYGGDFLLVANSAHNFVLMSPSLEKVIYHQQSEQQRFAPTHDLELSVSADGRSALLLGGTVSPSGSGGPRYTEVRHFRLGDRAHDGSIPIETNDLLLFEGDVKAIGFVDNLNTVAVAASFGSGSSASELYAVSLVDERQYAWDGLPRFLREMAKWTASIPERSENGERESLGEVASISQNGIVIGRGAGRFANALELRSADDGSLVWLFDDAGSRGHVVAQDGYWMAAADYERGGNIVRVWQLTQSKPHLLALINTGPESITGLAVAPDRTTLAVAIRTGEIRLFDATGGVELRRMKARPAPMHKLAFSYNGRHLINLTDSSFWPLTDFGSVGFAKSPVRLEIGHGNINYVSFSSLTATGEGSDLQLGISTFDGPLNLTEKADLPLVAEWKRHMLSQEYTGLVLFAPDGEAIATAGVNGGMALLETDGDVRWSESNEGRLSKLAFSPSGEVVVGFSDEDGRLIVRHTEDGSLIGATTRAIQRAHLADVSDTAVLVIDRYSVAKLIPFNDLSRNGNLEQQSTVHFVACSRSAPSCKTSGEKQWSRGANRDVWATAGSFLHDGRAVAIAYDNGELVIYDTKTRKPKQVFSVQANDKQRALEIVGVSYRKQTGELLITTEGEGATSHLLVLAPDRFGDAHWVTDLVPVTSKLSGDREVQYLSKNGQMLVLLGRTSSSKIQAVDLDLGISFPPAAVSVRPTRLALSDDGADIFWIDTLGEIRHFRVPVGRDVFSKACGRITTNDLAKLLNPRQLEEVEPICERHKQPPLILQTELSKR